MVSASMEKLLLIHFIQSCVLLQCSSPRACPGEPSSFCQKVSPWYQLLWRSIAHIYFPSGYYVAAVEDFPVAKESSAGASLIFSNKR